MSDSDNRNISRDSLFILAELRLDGQGEDHRVKVRNLSAGGMMGEGTVNVARGTYVEVNLRNVGWVAGSVAWVEGNRFGVAFIDHVDPSIIRQPAPAPEIPQPLTLRRIYSPKQAPGPTRKII